MPTFDRAPGLEPGDTVGLIAPSEPLARALVAPAASRLRERFDLAVQWYPTAERDPEAGPAPPVERARDVHDAAADCEAVMALIGGDDQLRVLPHLDGDRLREAEARIFGYSDNDNLRLFLWNHGVVSYGVQAFPDLAVGDELHPYVERYLRRALFEDRLGVVEPSAE